MSTAAACTVDPPPRPLPDAHAYLDATRLVATDPFAAADRCADVGGSAGDECVAWAAGAAARTDADRALGLCERITEPLWRDECGFLVAESTYATAGAKDAAARCAQAGRFADNCLMHVWKAHAAALVAERGLTDAAIAYGDAYAWADGVIPRDDALAEQFWDVFFDAALVDRDGRPARPVDLGWCDALTDELAGRCRHAVPLTLQRALNRADRRPAGAPGALDVAALCGPSGGSLPERVHAATGVTYVPHPALDDIVRRFVDRRCAGAPARMKREPPPPGAP